MKLRRNIVGNGCGLRGFKWLSHDLCFTECCNQHDEDYKYHTRSKKAADVCFYSCMITEASKIRDPTLRDYCNRRAKLYYLAVKWFGHIPYYVFYFIRKAYTFMKRK